jgi:pyroglutamyl-peptidase
VPTLVTGFEPFAGSSLNPSQLIVEALAAAHGDSEHIFAVLPVEYRLAGERLGALLEQHQPHTVICIGQAEGRNAISLDTRAQNLDDANLADNSGEKRTGRDISPGGPSDLSTTLPVDALLEQLEAGGIPAESSTSAGTFVCNHIFYLMQHQLEGSTVRSGFVHVPLVSEQASEFADKPTMPLVEQVRAFEIMLSYLEKK